MENQLLKKLQIKPDFSVNIIGAPAEFSAILGEIPSTVQLHHQYLGTTNAILIFAITKVDMIAALTTLKNFIDEKTICWICYPKANSNLAADLNLMQNWSDLTTFQLTPCASAAMNQTWTAMRIKPITALKKSGRANADIQKNEFAEYIDVQSKTVKLPEDLATALSESVAAINFYEQLSYSNKKEYVLWVLTAKQEKTRSERISKTVQKLLERKKNPTEK